MRSYARVIAVVMIVGVFVFSSFVMFIPTNVSAAPDEHVWDGGGADVYAGTHANWVSNIAPTVGDTIVFDSGALPCTWNLTFACGNFSMVTGYTGVLTIGASFEVSSFYQIAGTLTGSASYVLTSSGNVCHGGTAVVTTHVLRLCMTGEGSKLTGFGDYRLLGLQVSANITVTHNGGAVVYLAYGGAPYLTVDAGKTLTIASGMQLNVYLLAAFTYSNLGTIAGPGIFDARAYGSDKTISFGVIAAPCQIWMGGAEAASRTVSLGGDANFGSTLLMWSSHATNTITLSNGTNSQLVAAGTVTLNSRVIMNQGTGAWSFGAYLQSGVGSIFNQGGPLTINGDLTQTAGTFTGHEDYVVTVYGNVSQSGTAIVTTHVLRLRMMTDGTTLNGTDDYRLLGLQVSADVIITDSNSTVYLAYVGTTYLTVDSGAVMTIAHNKSLLIYLTSTSTFSNLGIVNGPGRMLFRPFLSNATVTFGEINANVSIWSTEAINRTISLGDDTTFGGDLLAWSSDTVHTLTVSHGANYSLTVVGQLEINSRLVMDQGTSTWAFGDYLQEGEGSVFNQAADVIVGTTFVQTLGTFNPDSAYDVILSDTFTTIETLIPNIVTTGTTELRAGTNAITASLPAFWNLTGFTNFSGPANAMTEAPNGDYLAFCRNATSHVALGDYGAMSLNRSTDNGITWTFEGTILSVPTRDVRNFASGVSETGRVFICYSVYDVDNQSGTNDEPYHDLHYMYSDDNGLTWSASIDILCPIIDGLVAVGATPYGTVIQMGSGRIGFTYDAGNTTHSQVRLAYSDDDGLTWGHVGMSEASEISTIWLTEMAIIYVGNDTIVGIVRQETHLVHWMFTSTDNGLTWANRGYVATPGVRPPTMTALTDSLGRDCILLVIAYGNIHYAVGLVGDLLEDGPTAWSPFFRLNDVYGGSYASLIFDDVAGTGLMMVNDQWNMTTSIARFFSVYAAINCTTICAANLTVNASATLVLINLVHIIDYCILHNVVNYGIITQDGIVLNITGSSSTPLTGYGRFDGDIYLNGTVASNYTVQLGTPMTGVLYTDRDMTVYLDTGETLCVCPLVVNFVGVSITSGLDWTIYGATTTVYSVSGLESTVGYKVYQDGVLIDQQLAGLTTLTFEATGGGRFEVVAWEPQSSGSGPMAYFEYTLVGNLLTCTDHSYNGVISWIWNFGDGYGSTDQNPTHKYTASGFYTLSLTVFDAEGRSSLATTQIEIVLGDDMPVERDDDGWNVWVSDSMTLGISAAGLLVGGALMFASSMYIKMPIITPKGRRVLGLIMMGAGAYFFIFVDNTWLG